MRRILLSLAIVVLAVCCASSALSAHDTPLINHFKISLYSPSQKKLIPLIVCDNGKFSVSRRARLVPGSLLHVSLSTTIPDKWVSVVFRDTYGRIYDLPYEQRKVKANTKEVMFRIPGRFPPGEVEAYLALWADFDEVQNANEGMMYNTGFMNIGEYTF